MQTSFSYNAEPAGRLRENSLTLEDCISQVYAGLEQAGTALAGYRNMQSHHWQPIAQLPIQPVASSSFDPQDTTSLFQLDFSVPSDFNFSLIPEFSFQPIEPRSAPVVPHIPLLAPFAESIFSWAPEKADYCRYVDGTSEYDNQVALMNDLGFGVDPMAVVSDGLASYYAEASVTTNGSSGTPLPDFPSEAPQAPPLEVWEARPLPRSAMKRRANPRWSPSSDETVSDDEYPSSSRKRRAATSLWRDTKRMKVEEVAQGEVWEQIPEKIRTNRERGSDDRDVSLTIYEQPLVVRCPALSGCVLRFGSVKEALEHCGQAHRGRYAVRQGFRCIFRTCDQGFTALGDVARHVESLIHTPRKRQRCLACLRSFTRVDALKRHCNLAGAAHVSLHQSRVAGGVQAVCDVAGLWTLKAPEGFKDSCRISKLAIDTVSWIDTKPTRGRYSQ